jgi:hypothetical protein
MYQELQTAAPGHYLGHIIPQELPTAAPMGNRSYLNQKEELGLVKKFVLLTHLRRKKTLVSYE